VVVCHWVRREDVEFIVRPATEHPPQLVLGGSASVASPTAGLLGDDPAGEEGREAAARVAHHIRSESGSRRHRRRPLLHHSQAGLVAVLGDGRLAAVAVAVLVALIGRALAAALLGIELALAAVLLALLGIALAAALLGLALAALIGLALAALIGHALAALLGLALAALIGHALAALLGLALAAAVLVACAVGLALAEGIGFGLGLALGLGNTSGGLIVVARPVAALDIALGLALSLGFGSALGLGTASGGLIVGVGLVAALYIALGLGLGFGFGLALALSPGIALALSPLPFPLAMVAKVVVGVGLAAAVAALVASGLVHRLVAAVAALVVVGRAHRHLDRRIVDDPADLRWPATATARRPAARPPLRQDRGLGFSQTDRRAFAYGARELVQAEAADGREGSEAGVVVHVSAPHAKEQILSKKESGEPLHNNSGEPLHN
jgi:hypothetical protein